MKQPRWLIGICCFAVIVVACSSKPSPKEATTTQPAALREWKSGYRVYVTNESSGDLSIIDGTTLEVIANIPLGKRPRGIHASPDKRTIYVALSGTPPAPPGVDESTLPPPDRSADGIGVFDVDQNKQIRVIEGGLDPENFDISRDGKTIFVSNEDTSAVTFIDLATGKPIQTITGLGGEPEGVTLSPDGKLVYVTTEAAGAISVIDVGKRKLIKSFKVGRRPRNIIFLPDGKRGYVNAENDGSIILFDAVKNEKIKAIQLGTPGEIKPMGLALSPDASKLYVSTGRGGKVFVVDTATNQPLSSFDVGKRPWGIALAPDGKTLFTANGPSNDVSVVNLENQTVIKRIQVSGSPWGIQIIGK